MGGFGGHSPGRGGGGLLGMIFGGGKRARREAEGRVRPIPSSFPSSPANHVSFI